MTYTIASGASKTSTKNGLHFVLSDHNKNYGPTIKKEHQDYLPYYALSMILMSDAPNMASQFQKKWDDYISNAKDVYLDNDLKGRIETKIRSTWRYNG